ncbi:glycoside hydrolase TIM-barrel-like domain-containing protein [Plastorhodobacter daqingensis]|uniref:Glycoside hydrolase TIM-barrel-like domain-containing protein n=1 Tax=Plastorhodobacter daqingensis TaxID=1387281 RepID=A0ABW2UJU9_9RHOB
MATIVLGAVGSAVGAGFGGTVLGLSGAVIGRAVGATLGRVIDQRLLGAGSETVETGKVDRFRLTGASEGAAVPLVYGRMRMAGQVIWATRFAERTERSTSGGGKGAPQPKVTTVSHSYSVSLAIALCEGVITRVGRVWADGEEIPRDDLPLRVHTGTEDQLPDAKIAAVEGVDQAPAYRGIAYVVLEDLELGRFGNRVPQFTFEVFRPAEAPGVPDLVRGIEAVALMPGTGEYALATQPVHFDKGLGEVLPVNINTPSGKADLAVSLEQLREELPRVGSVLLIASWFGDDLRCGQCRVRPKVEQTAIDGREMPWRVSGLTRETAQVIAGREGRPIYGGTPADASVIQALRALKAQGQRAVFYPFLLMEQREGNSLPDPWTGAEGQPALPWRGRITTAKAPGRTGTTDRTAAAAAEVAAFFGSCQPGDFRIDGEQVIYTGPEDWGYRRFILHYAHLCKAAGGIDAFCVGSEMRSLTQIRGANDSFPAVAEFRRLAAEVRAILGDEVKISYAADWSEYFGYSADGNRYFHLDPLWADENVDFIGIDNYMPLSDWRDGDDHADAAWGTIHNLDYLKANIEGGEGYDWYYPGPEALAAQNRVPIEDGAYGEHWIWRYKDLRNWWANAHHERIDGQRLANPTAWEPASKPIWFTELGCAAVDKGTNEPNKFLDPKSSESSLPRFSSGARDDLIQMQYLRAMADYWGDPAHNPVSDMYGGRMVDMSRAHVWAWDARPYPAFPNNRDLWADGENHARGHWLTGRTAAQPLANVVAELCERSGLRAYDVSGLHGLVRGYVLPSVESARAALQPLMLAHGFEAVERDGVLRFQMRDGRVDGMLDQGQLALGDRLDALTEAIRAPEAEIAGRVRLGFVEAEGDYAARTVEAIFPDEATHSVSHSELPLALTEAEARAVTERWLAEARVARDGLRFALPPSSALGAGDVVLLGGARWRIDRVEQAGVLNIEAVRVEPGVYQPSDAADLPVRQRPFAAPVPVLPVFLDLPLLRGTEVAHAPHLAVTATPWPGAVAVWQAETDNGYVLNRTLSDRAVIGQTLTSLDRARPGVWDRGAPLRVRMSGPLVSASPAEVLNGANALAIGAGTSQGWEVLQFARADLVGPGVYDLSLRLRGQAGTEQDMPEVWPAGSRVVLLNAAVRQIDLPLSARDLARHYRIGPAQCGYDDPSYTHLVEAFRGIGLRPYAPCHLRLRQLADGLEARWLRRTRIDGDSWAGMDVPLGEESEAYLVRILKDGALRRETVVTRPFWTYGAAEQAADGIERPFRIEVAQLSAQYGAGSFTGIEIDD